MLKRLFDILFSLSGLIILSPLFIFICIAILLESKGGAFYKQVRVGRNNTDFNLLKFRSMYVNADKKGLLTVGDKDNRITKVGYYIRKYKLDELPQLLNVLKGDMSFVGPRPEVRKYVSMYTQDQLKVLYVKPGITDPASIKYIDENRLLSQSQEPEKTYIELIMPEKLRINLEYINNQSFLYDLSIIFQTVFKVIHRG